jgi:hypothetical protein
MQNMHRDRSADGMISRIIFQFAQAAIRRLRHRRRWKRQEFRSSRGHRAFRNTTYVLSARARLIAKKETAEGRTASRKKRRKDAGEERRVGNEGLNGGIRTSQRRKFNLLPAWRPFLVIVLIEARLSSTPRRCLSRSTLRFSFSFPSLSLFIFRRSFSLTTSCASPAIRVRDVPFCRHRRDSDEAI